MSTEEKKIGARIADLRKRRGMTQLELADKLHMRQSLLSRYERGVVRLHGQLVAEFAKALRVSADELLGLKETKSNGLVPERRFLRRLQKVHKLSKRQKEILLGTIDAFLKSANVG
jgi:transcriptional regulator with XRE-family HTH domain